MSSYTVTLIPGDGIGPEVTDAMVKVLEATGVDFEWDVVEAGEKALKRDGTPLPQAVIDSMKKNKVAIKGPLTTPIGGGYRSVNVSLRQMLNLYASIRPSRTIAGVGTLYSNIDLVVIREATEELYSGIEHWIDREHSAAETISVVTRKASERIVKYAFDYAVSEKRRKVTSVHKANIMKTTGALFQEVSQKIAKNYPSIEFDGRKVFMPKKGDSLEL